MIEPFFALGLFWKIVIIGVTLWFAIPVFFGILFLIHYMKKHNGKDWKKFI